MTLLTAMAEEHTPAGIIISTQSIAAEEEGNIERGHGREADEKEEEEEEEASEEVDSDISHTPSSSNKQLGNNSDSNNRSRQLSFHEKRSQDAWEKRLSELTEFKNTYGTTVVPLTKEMEQYRSLARWANNKRLQFHKKQLPTHEKEALDAIGFDWKQTRKDVWDEYFRHLIKFKAQFGHTKVSGDYQYEENQYDLVPLRNWCRTQRMRFRKNTLQDDRMDKLDKIGFNFCTNGENWSRLFQSLSNFKRNHGHFNVPQESYLGRWAARLPLHKKELRKDQVARLDAIGFDWTPRTPMASGVESSRGIKRQAELDNFKPAAKRSTGSPNHDLAMPSMGLGLSPITNALGASQYPGNSAATAATDLLGSLLHEHSFNNAARSNAERQSILLALQAQRAFGLARPSLSPELLWAINSTPIPSLSQWNPHQPLQLSQSSNHDTVPQNVMDELRRRMLLENLQRQQQLQLVQKQQDLELERQEERLHRQLESVTQGSPSLIPTHQQLLRSVQLQAASNNNFLGVGSVNLNEQDFSSGKVTQHIFRQQQLQQLRQEKPAVSYMHNADFVQQIRRNLHMDKASNNNHTSATD
jgi:hypothetical protein